MLLDGPRGCREYELAQVLDVGNVVMRILAGQPANWGHSWPHVYCASNIDNVRLIKVEYQVVSSMAIFTTEVRAGALTLKVGGINGVATLPEFRRHGLAGLLLEDCHAKMLSDGCDIGLLNTAIYDWYRRFDWENGSTEKVYYLDRGSIGYLPQLKDVDISEGVEEHIDDVIALHEGESYAARRERGLYPILLSRPHYRTYLARRDGDTIAYAVVARGRIVEYGGEAETVAGLIREVFARLDDPSASTSTVDDGREPLTGHLQVTASPSGNGLGDYLGKFGIPHQLAYFGMIRIINPAQLINKIAPRITVEEEGDKVILDDEGERLQMDRRALVKLLLGPERVTSFADDILPFPFYQWPADKV